MTGSIPLFPLHTVLFPGALLPLRIFETRYLDMVSRCMRTQSVFGICLIEAGSEVGAPARCADRGTSARIVDWRSLPGGVLGITVRGERRFRVVRTSTGTDNLLSADVEWLGDREMPVPADLSDLQDLARRIAGGTPKSGMAEPPADDAGRVAYRLAGLLPLEPRSRQALLEIDDPVSRLRRIRGMLDSGAAGTRTGDS